MGDPDRYRPGEERDWPPGCPRSSQQLADNHRHPKDVEWRMGLDGVTPVAVASANMSTFRGRRIAMGGTKQFGMRLDGSVGAIQDYTYNTEIARECIERVAAAQGWNQSASRSPMGASEKIGLGVAIGAIVLAVGILAVIFL